MGIASIIRTVFEVLLVGFTFWAVFNEHKFIAFEEKLLCGLRRKKMKTVKGGRTEKIVEFNF